MNKDYVRWAYIAVCVPLAIAAAVLFVIIAWEVVLGFLFIIVLLLCIAAVIHAYHYARAGWLWCNSDKTWKQAKREYI